MLEVENSGNFLGQVASRCTVSKEENALWSLLIMALSNVMLAG